MPAAKNAIKMSWIPRGEGKGGIFTNATYHDQVPDSTFNVTNVLVQNNAWTPFYNFITYGSFLGVAVDTLEIFNRYAGVTQTLTSNVIAGISNDGAGKSKVVNQTTGAVIRSSGTPQATTTTGRYVFAPVKNRLYMCNGTDAPVISPDATASSCVSWGKNGQTPNLAYQVNARNLLGAGQTNANVLGGTQGTGTVTTLTTLTWVSGPNFQYFQAGAVIYVNGVYNTVAFVNSNTVLTLTFNAVNAAGVAFSYAPTGMQGNATYTGANAGVPGLNTLTVWAPQAPAAGLPAFIVGPGPPTMQPPGGSPAFIAGAASPVTPSVKYSFINVTGVAAGVISPTYQEQTGGAAVVRNTQINFSNMNWTAGNGYQYAVSYYSPPTGTGSGHVSNVSPVLNVKDGAPLNANASVTISNIVTTNDSFYTKIILWRSGAGTSTLYPLAILNNDNGNAAGNTITYTDFLGDDTALGTASGGPGKLAAPISGTNTPPPADLNFTQYWDGRFWGASQTQVGLVFFSCRSSGNTEDTTIGVPEECWPLNFTLNLPEADGRVTGLRTVGNNLFVLSDNNIYAVIGSDKLSYGLARVSAKGHGTAHFATAVIPAEDVNSTDVLVHYGNDNRLYFLFGSGGDFQVSYPIQTLLNGAGGVIGNVTVGVVHTAVSTYVFLNVPGGGAIGPLYYDLERKLWDGQPGFTLWRAFTEGLVNGVLTQYYSDIFGNVLTTSTISGPPAAYSITTNTVSPTGTDRKDNKILESVSIYTTEPASNIFVTPTIDGVAGANLVAVPSTGQYGKSYHEFTDALVFVPQTLAAGRLFSFQVGTVGLPANFSSAIYEIVATWAGDQSPEAAGASL
jgi:hypothetical protein